jgi:hypothetical protein
MVLASRRTLGSLVVVCGLFTAGGDDPVRAQAYCVDAQMKALVACPPSESADPPPLLEDSTSDGGIRNKKPGADAGCGRGLGFCCFCHTALSSPVAATRALDAGLLRNPTDFWPRHRTISRQVPPDAKHRTMKRRQEMPSEYDALLRARPPAGG